MPANRYRSDGCTVNDLIREQDPWRDHDEFVAHVDAVTDELKRAGVITGNEQGRSWPPLVDLTSVADVAPPSSSA